MSRNEILTQASLGQSFHAWLPRLSMAVCLSAAACSAVRWCIPASEMAILAQWGAMNDEENLINFDVVDCCESTVTRK